MERNLLTAAELAKELRVSKQTILRAYKRGEIKNVGLSTSPRFDLRQFIEE